MSEVPKTETKYVALSVSIENEVSDPIKKRQGVVYDNSEEKYIKQIDVYGQRDNNIGDHGGDKLYYDKEFTKPVKEAEFEDILKYGILHYEQEYEGVGVVYKINTPFVSLESVLDQSDITLWHTYLYVETSNGILPCTEGDDPPDWDTYKLEPATGALNGEFRFWFKESDLTYVDGTGLVWEHQLSAEDAASLYNLLQTGRSYGSPELIYNSDDRSSNACYCQSSAKQGTQYDTSETGHIKIKKSSNYYLDFNNDGNSLMLIIPPATVENFSTGDVAFINHQAVYYVS